MKKLALALFASALFAGPVLAQDMKVAAVESDTVAIQPLPDEEFTAPENSLACNQPTDAAEIARVADLRVLGIDSQVTVSTLTATRIASLRCWTHYASDNEVADGQLFYTGRVLQVIKTDAGYLVGNFVDQTVTSSN